MKSAVSSWVWIALAAAVLAVLLTQAWREPAAMPSATVDAAAGARMIEKALRNPKSFELIQIRAIPPNVTCYEYRAQNGFGGMNIESALRLGQTILTQTDPNFPKLWNANCGAQSHGVDVTEQAKQLLASSPSA